MNNPQCVRCGEFETFGTMHLCPDVKPALIRTGDTVLHKPSGESWVVACVRGDYLAWCGWPEGEAKLADCELQTSATDEQHWYWVQQIAEANAGFRSRYCQSLLASHPPFMPPQQQRCPHCQQLMPASTPARDDAPAVVAPPVAPATNITDEAPPSGWRDKPKML